ncbi:MAG: rhomboid family intramembrane serine protease [Saprospiraceae bacterium]
MFRSIWDDVKREYSYGNMVTRIIIINLAFFVIVKLLWVVLMIGNAWVEPEIYRTISRFFMISSDWKHNLTHPWVIITHMFFHQDVFHILWNMLFLYWFGRIVGDLLGNHRVLPLYLLGGLVGGIAYFITSKLLFQHTGFALGASGAVMAIVVAAGTTSPDYIMRLILLGDIKLKYIVGALVLLDVIGMGSNINTGGRIAHLGGAFFGWVFVRQLREGNDLSISVNKLLAWLQQIFKGIKGGNPLDRKGPKVVYRNPNRKKMASNVKGNAASDYNDMSYQEQLDSILEKIKKTGYENLTEEEKEFLFNASKK